MSFVLPDEERFADFLRSALQDVHTPIPTAPREAMWASIMEQRQGDRVNAGAVRGTNVSTGQTSSRATNAAVQVSPRGFSRAEIGSASVVATQGAMTPTATSNVTAPNPKNTLLRRRYAIPMRWAVPVAAVVLVVGASAGWQFEHLRSPHLAPLAEAPAPLPPELPTQVAVEQHLKEVEHLVAYFENPSSATVGNSAVTEAQVAAWARDLLATTQLLIDSPLGMDPQSRKLLTDVEMILVQISQGPNAMPEERELTEQSIEESKMMERLQQAPPVTSPSQKAPQGT